MKRFFKGHIFFGSMVAREDDEFIDNVDSSLEVRPDALRWFCGLHDLKTFACQAL